MDLIQAKQFLCDLETGKERIINDDFSLNIENKQKILEVFRVLPTVKMKTEEFEWFDKIPLFSNITHFRAAPGTIIRRGSNIQEGVVLMPSFINVGSYIGQKTMIDSGVTVGSCAYIGSKCHISSNTVIAGVLEPIMNMPVVIEDDCFIGAQCLISEGVHIGKGSIIGAGTILTSSTKIIDKNTHKLYKNVPQDSVVIPGSYAIGRYNIHCAIIIKQVDEKTRAKTSINEILRMQ